MLTIPDKSLHTVFDTMVYFDVPLGVPVTVDWDISALNLASSLSMPTINYQTVTWAYDGDGISAQWGEPVGNQISIEPNQTQLSYQLPALIQPSAYIVWLSWTNQQNQTMQTGQIGYLARYNMPFYASIQPQFQTACQTVLNTWTFLHDNAYGNSRPNEAEKLQIHFSLEDVAQSMNVGLMTFQAGIIQPTFYNLQNNPLPTPKYLGLLYECALKELTHRVMIGYIETPTVEGNPDVAYIDRRDYYQRWETEYKRIGAELDKIGPIFQREQLNLTGCSILVGGGYFSVGTPLMTNQTIDAIGNGTLQNNFFPVWINVDGNCN